MSGFGKFIFYSLAGVLAVLFFYRLSDSEFFIDAPARYTNQVRQTAYEKGYKLGYAEQRDLRNVYKEGYDESDKQYIKIKDEYEHRAKQFTHNTDDSAEMDAFVVGVNEGATKYQIEQTQLKEATAAAAKAEKAEEQSQSQTVVMMAPDKRVENVPEAEVKKYADKGYKIAVSCKHSDGTVEWNTIDKTSEATGCL